MGDPAPQLLYKYIGTRIKDLRAAHRINQKDLASRVGLSRTSITNIELGKQRLLVDQLFRIADALGGEADELLPNRSNLGETASTTMNPHKKKLTDAQLEWARRVIGQAQGG